MSDAAPNWVVPMMRLGYGARAAVYAVLGGLTLAAAWAGGATEDTQGALAQLRDEPFGIALLWLIGLGLMCFAAWRLVAAWYDLERRGDDEKGVFARIALVVSGIWYGALGVSVVALARGNSSGGGDWTTKMMGMPFGKWIAAAVGLALLGVAAFHLYKGWARTYERNIQVTSTTRRLDPAMRAGFVAHAIVVGIVGAFLVIAALQADPSQAKGVGDALSYVRGMAFGRVLLGLLGLGLLGYALENAIEAIYRVVPRLAGPEVRTLGDWAEEKARQAGA